MNRMLIHQMFMERDRTAIPTNGLKFYQPLDKDYYHIPTGQQIRNAWGNITYHVIDGIKCAYFQGNGQALMYYPQTTGFPTGKAARAFSFWYRPTSSDYVLRMTYGTNKASQRWQIALTNGSLHLYAYSNTASVSSAGGGAPTRTLDWHHNVSMYSGTTVDWYHNGKFLASAAFGTPANINTADNIGFCIGMQSASFNAVQNAPAAGSDIAYSRNVYISSVRVYTRALEPSEITALYNEFQPIS